jgi:hypothetical protein
MILRVSCNNIVCYETDIVPLLDDKAAAIFSPHYKRSGCQMWCRECVVIMLNYYRVSVTPPHEDREAARLSSICLQDIIFSWTHNASHTRQPSLSWIQYGSYFLRVQMICDWRSDYVELDGLDLAIYYIQGIVINLYDCTTSNIFLNKTRYSPLVAMAAAAV